MSRHIEANLTFFFFSDATGFFNGKGYGISWSQIHKVKTQQLPMEAEPPQILQILHKFPMGLLYPPYPAPTPPQHLDLLEALAVQTC